MKTFVAANSQELGSRFHLFAAKTRIDTFIKILFYLICAFILEFQLKSKVNFGVSLCLCHSYGTTYAAKIK